MPSLRPTARPASPLLPRRRTRKATALPVLPLAAACLLLLAALQLALWWWKYEDGLPSVRQAFPNLAALHPAAMEEGAAPRAPVEVEAPVLPQNLQFGDPNARVVVTIFNDPSCGECRKQVKRRLAGVPVEGVKLVYKFWPVDATRLTPGMLVQLARREGVAGDFWQRLQARDGDFDDTTLLSLLDASGLPLAKQGDLLAKDSGALMDVLKGDIHTAEANHLPPPPVILVNGMLLDGAILDPAQLPVYVRRMLAGKPPVDGGDFWLMRK